MKRARVLVSGELIRQAMYLPASASLVDITFDPSKDLATFIIDDVTLPESDQVVDRNPVMRRVLWDWGVE